jgi:hypothetical protein
MAIDVEAIVPGYDFQGARFDLEKREDREIVCFMLSQALFGEATGVYCGKSLYAAHSLEAARFYLRQAKQELSHLELFAEIFRQLELQPVEAHWVVRLLSSHNNYYPFKVLMEHAIGEGMVLDIFKDVLLQTLPEHHPASQSILKKLRVVCAEEVEHVQWGEKEVRRLLAERPWLKWPFFGVVELQLAVLPFLVRAFERRAAGHPVLRHLRPFSEHVMARVLQQSRDLGFYPAERPGFARRWAAMAAGALMFVRSQFARSFSTLDRTYLAELGFRDPAPANAR